MKLIYNDQRLSIYQHDAIEGRINIYHFRNGEITFGAENVSILNRFEKTWTYGEICKVLTHK